MKTRPFIEKSNKPNPDTLKKALSSSYKFYESLLTQVTKFKHDWNFSKTSGWMQKISDSKKALFYVIPLDGSFMVNLTVRENERDLLLADKTISLIHVQLTGAKKYSEGYLLSFHIQNSKDASICFETVGKLIKTRL